ncbi:MAG: hypothetical protein CMG55_09430 [Candidatus Marinimicrobia bacterium]|nr:hypothetical protein [Candidatus Neomarinimicrobiota bacterium]
MKLFIILSLHVLLIAKTKPIRGYIVGEDLNAIENVRITSLPSKTITSTKAEGIFNFLIPIKDRQLIISKQGYHSDTLNVILFKNNTRLILKEYIVDNPLDNINQYITFIVSRRDKNLFHYPLENFYMSGYGNLKSILLENSAITLKPGLDGLESISLRGITHLDMDILYDGIKFDGLVNPLMNASITPELAVSDLVISKGGHYKLTASQGAINFIPNISYDNKFSFNIKKSHIDLNSSFDGYASLGYKYGAINGSWATNEIAVAYEDTSAPEVFTQIDRNAYNIAYTNAKNLDVRFMSFDNLKNYSNQRTFGSSSDSIRNKIFKFSQWSPLTGLITIFGSYQQNQGQSYFNSDTILNDNSMTGFGMSLEKDFGNSTYTFSTLTNLLDIDYIFNSDSILSDRQNSIFSGSAKYYFTKKSRFIYLKDFSVVYTKERTTDMRKKESPYILKSNYWDNNNFQLRGSFMSERFPRISLFYINMGNVFRTPSVDEVLNNRLRIIKLKNKVLPEQNTMAEMGFVFNSKKSSNQSNYQIELSNFFHNYKNKIQRVLVYGSPLNYPSNSGNVNIYGFNCSIKYQPKYNWIDFETIFTNYSIPELSFFSLQPRTILKHHTHIKTKYFNVLLMMRNEGEKYFTLRKSSGILEDIKLGSSNYLSVMVYKNINYKILNLNFNLLGENLQSNKLIINELNIYDNKYSININVSII